MKVVGEGRGSSGSGAESRKIIRSCPRNAVDTASPVGVALTVVRELSECRGGFRFDALTWSWLRASSFSRCVSCREPDFNRLCGFGYPASRHVHVLARVHRSGKP